MRDVVTYIGASDRRYRHRKMRGPCPHKSAVNLRLARLFTLGRTALVLDDVSLGTSIALAAGHRTRLGKGAVIVTNPCASRFKVLPRHVRLVDSTVECFLDTIDPVRTTFDLIYLDFCSSFIGCFDTVEASIPLLSERGTLAYTFCNRGVDSELIAFNALRQREMARQAGLTFHSCEAYRDMITVIVTRSPLVEEVEGRQEVEARREGGHFFVEGFRGWRVHLWKLELRVKWAGYTETTWEPASRLIEDTDRGTFMRLIHMMS